MAEKLCELKKKGGGGGAKQTETVLWTNPNPTSSSGFAAQTVTLSDDINNYDYICVSYGFNSTNMGNISKTHYLVSEFKNFALNGGVRHYIGQGGAQDASNNTYARDIYYVSDTSIGFTTGYGVNKVLSAADVLIPTSIIGIKNIGGIRTNEKYDTLPFTSVAGNAIPTFATKGRAKAIWMPYMFQATSAHRSFLVTNVNPATGEIDNDSYPWYIDTSNLNNYGQISAYKFVVTDSSVTLSASPSSSNLYVGFAYTY